MTKKLTADDHAIESVKMMKSSNVEPSWEDFEEIAKLYEEEEKEKKDKNET